MSAPPSHRSEQGSAFGPSLLNLKRLVKLTDAAQELFGTLYDLEKQHKAANKVRLSRALLDLDVFGLTVNRTDAAAQEYQPAEPGWYT